MTLSSRPAKPIVEEIINSIDADDDEKAAPAYRRPLSRRIRNLKSALAKLDPQPPPLVEPLPPPRAWTNSSIGQRKRLQ